MHQHEPPAAPHSNDVPQQAQASRRSACNRESVDAVVIAALSGFIACKINHAGVTGLRQMGFKVIGAIHRGRVLRQ